MRATRNTTEVFAFFQKARPLYPKLKIEIEKDHLEKADEIFLRKVGIGINTKKSWYRTGIKPLYWNILKLLEASPANDIAAIINIKN